MKSLLPQERFLDKASDYASFRPGYPEPLLTVLRDRFSLGNDWIIADIGSGTGILTELLLKNGNQVFAVEPNGQMRQYAEKTLSNYPQFVAINGSAESTTLKDDSVDLIVCAQSFHWFEPKNTKREFIRISKIPHRILLLWNERIIDGCPFDAAYERFINSFGVDYDAEKHTNFSNLKNVREFFTPNKFDVVTLKNHQDLDFPGLLGRLLSCSYMPNREDPIYPQMEKELLALFNRYAQDHLIRINYRTLVIFGRLSGDQSADRG